MQLYVWGSAFNAPSIDPKCIVIEAYLRLVKQEYTVVTCNDPQTSPTGQITFFLLLSLSLYNPLNNAYIYIYTYIGELPLLKHGAVWVAGADRILSHLVKLGKDANKDLTPEQKAEYFA